MRSKMEVEHALIARYLDIVRLEDLGVLAAEQEDLAGLFVRETLQNPANG